MLLVVVLDFGTSFCRIEEQVSYTLQEETAPRSLDAPSLPGLARLLRKAEGVDALPTGAHVHMRRGGSVVGVCNTTSSSLAQAPQA